MTLICVFKNACKKFYHKEQLMLQQNNYNYTAHIKTNKLTLQSCFSFCLFVFDKSFGGRCCIIRACNHEAKTTFEPGLISVLSVQTEIAT